MSDVKTLYERNARFTQDFAFADLGMKPKLSTVILTCMDCRVDPAYFLGLEPGECFVLRNSGGRVTAAVERDLALIWTLASQISGGDPNLDLAIIHHTDCGLEKFADAEVQEMVSQLSGVPQSTLKELAIVEHDTAFADDIRRLKQSELVPDGLVASTHLYDPKRGRLSPVEV